MQRVQKQTTRKSKKKKNNSSHQNTNRVAAGAKGTELITIRTQMLKTNYRYTIARNGFETQSDCCAKCVTVSTAVTAATTVILCTMYTLIHTIYVLYIYNKTIL